MDNITRKYVKSSYFRPNSLYKIREDYVIEDISKAMKVEMTLNGQTPSISFIGDRLVAQYTSRHGCKINVLLYEGDTGDEFFCDMYLGGCRENPFFKGIPYDLAMKQLAQMLQSFFDSVIKMNLISPDNPSYLAKDLIRDLWVHVESATDEVEALAEAHKNQEYKPIASMVNARSCSVTFRIENDIFTYDSVDGVRLNGRSIDSNLLSSWNNYTSTGKGSMTFDSPWIALEGGIVWIKSIDTDLGEWNNKGRYHITSCKTKKFINVKFHTGTSFVIDLMDIASIVERSMSIVWAGLGNAKVVGDTVHIDSLGGTVVVYPDKTAELLDGSHVILKRSRDVKEVFQTLQLSTRYREIYRDE